MTREKGVVLEVAADRVRIATRAIVLSGGELTTKAVLAGAGVEYHPQRDFLLREAADEAERVKDSARARVGVD